MGRSFGCCTIAKALGWVCCIGPLGSVSLQRQWGVFAAPSVAVGHLWVVPLGVAPLQRQCGGFVVPGAAVGHVVGQPSVFCTIAKALGWVCCTRCGCGIYVGQLFGYCTIAKAMGWVCGIDPLGFAPLQCQWSVFAAPGAPVGHVWVGPLGVAPLQSQWGGFVALAFDILQHCNVSGVCLLHPVWL